MTATSPSFTLPLVPIDFNRGLDPSPTGTPRYGVGFADDWQLDGPALRDRMPALFVQWGELQMEGVLHVEPEVDGRVYWIAELNPATLRYHLFIPGFHHPLAGRITLGVAGTREADLCADWLQAVLVAARYAVDAHIAVETWEGHQVWLADPDWNDVRLKA